MFTSANEKLLVCIKRALSVQCVANRCAELTVLLDRANSSDQQQAFELLIDSIFGSQTTFGWGLRKIKDSDNDDNIQLQHFLGPCGPLFKLMYNLLKDPSLKYSFPIACLPLKVREALENTQMHHPFYGDLIHYNTETDCFNSLYLNPFDYYMFHFAYHLINPVLLTNANQPWNTTYQALSVTYMLHFLPCDPNVTVLPTIYHNVKCSTQTFHTLEERSQTDVRLFNIPQKPTCADEYVVQSGGWSKRNEIWRTETVLNVLIDLWLTNDQITNLSGHLSQSMPINRYFQQQTLPSAEYLRIVRIFIKQLHAFSTSAMLGDSSLADLKRTAIPMVQIKLYVMLQALIYHWPLDGSFRLVLELWFTFIQPWRYAAVPYEQANLDNDDNEINRHQYLPFIANNLLMYTEIFRQILPKLIHADLISPKMSIMLYRMTKVFSQANLPELLREVENCLLCQSENENCVQSNFSSVTNSWNLLPSDAMWNNTTHNDFTTYNNSSSTTSDIVEDKKWSLLIRQKMMEFCGPEFKYQPLFVSTPSNTINELVNNVQEAIDVAYTVLHERKCKEDEAHISTSWLMSLIKQLWDPSVNDTDEFTLNDRIKTPSYLEISLIALQEMFNVQTSGGAPFRQNQGSPTNEDYYKQLEYQQNSSSNAASSLNTTSICTSSNNYLSLLTPKSVRKRIACIEYNGNPDLYPIRSNENAFLVRIFFYLATFLNLTFGHWFFIVYEMDNYFGRLCRQFLMQPLTIYHYDKTQLGSPRVSAKLPPRVSFRPYANYRFILSVAMGFICMKWLLSLDVILYSFILFTGHIVYKCLKSVPYKTSVQHSHYFTTVNSNSCTHDDDD